MKGSPTRQLMIKYETSFGGRMIFGVRTFLRSSQLGACRIRHAAYLFIMSRVYYSGKDGCTIRRAGSLAVGGGHAKAPTNQLFLLIPPSSSRTATRAVVYITKRLVGRPTRPVVPSGVYEPRAPIICNKTRGIEFPCFRMLAIVAWNLMLWICS